MSFQISQLTPYELGILFSIGSYIPSKQLLTLRHKIRYFLEQIEQHISYKIYSQNSRTGIQHVLKIYFINIQQLSSLNWTYRNSEIRDIPTLSIYKDFLRAYIEIHSSLDYSLRYSHNKTNKHRALRLRIYGNHYIIESLNQIISKECNVNLKTVQNLSNNKTSYLQYTSLIEIKQIYNYIFDYPYSEEYWNSTEIKLQNPKIL